MSISATIVNAATSAVYKIPQLISVLSQINSDHTLLFYFLKIHFNVPPLGPPNNLLPSCFPLKNVISTFIFHTIAHSLISYL